MLNVGIVNYGTGNIASVIKAVEYAGADAKLVSTPEEILACDKIILPGVGASGLAIEKLREKNLDQALDQAIRKEGKPLLGICVGMQLLATDMYEFGHHKGLGWIPGKVVRLTDLNIGNVAVPNMGWSDVIFHQGNGIDTLAKKLGRHKAFYFAHSYTLVTDKSVVSSTVDYGCDLVAGVSFDTVTAFQFHPEKSQVAGDILLQWFMDWTP